MTRYPCSAGDSKNRLHDWRGSFDYHSTKEEKFVGHVHRKRSRRNRFPDVGGCNICYTAKSPGVCPAYVCAYCGLHVCYEHYAPLTKTYCQRGELEYLDSYYLHEWYKWDVYNDETKWPIELRVLDNTGIGSEIEIVGFRNGKLVVKSTGVVLPPGGKVTAHEVLRPGKV
jgi:hypothetical protein